MYEVYVIDKHPARLNLYKSRLHAPGFRVYAHRNLSAIGSDKIDILLLSEPDSADLEQVRAMSLLGILNSVVVVHEGNLELSDLGRLPVYRLVNRRLTSLGELAKIVQSINF